MLTEDQRQIFSKMLDLKYDAKMEKDFKKKFALIQKLNAQEKLLKESMGEAQYQKFISMGQRMFA